MDDGTRSRSESLSFSRGSERGFPPMLSTSKGNRCELLFSDLGVFRTYLLLGMVRGVVATFCARDVREGADGALVALRPTGVV